MDFDFNEQQEMLKKAARDFLQTNCPESLVRNIEKGEKGYSSELWREIAKLGWLGITFPEEYGGSGGNFLDLAALYEEMGRVMFPSPHLSTVVLCGHTILNAGSEEQKAELLPQIVKGELILSLALTEPSASWDADGVSVKAIPDGNEYVIDGTKLFIHDAQIADYLLCVARTKHGTTPDEGITLFLVDARSRGLSYTLLDTLAGDKQSDVTFNHVRIPKKNMIGELHGGWAPLVKALQQGAVMLCAEMVGAGQRILELTVDYAKTRVQFDLPVGINQYVQDHCVNMLAEVRGSEWVTHQAAWRLSEGLPCDMEVATAKAWSSDAHEKVCWRAHQVFGSMGFAIQLSIIPLYSRRAKAAHHYLGDAVYWRKKVAQQIDDWSHERPKAKTLGLWKYREPLV